MPPHFFRRRLIKFLVDRVNRAWTETSPVPAATTFAFCRGGLLSSRRNRRRSFCPLLTRMPSRGWLTVVWSGSLPGGESLSGGMCSTRSAKTRGDWIAALFLVGSGRSPQRRSPGSSWGRPKGVALEPLQEVSSSEALLARHDQVSSDPGSPSGCPWKVVLAGGLLPGWAAAQHLVWMGDGGGSKGSGSSDIDGAPGDAVEARSSDAIGA